jgi:hypothetical protein
VYPRGEAVGLDNRQNPRAHALRRLYIHPVERAFVDMNRSTVRGEGRENIEDGERLARESADRRRDLLRGLRCAESRCRSDIIAT